MGVVGLVLITPILISRYMEVKDKEFTKLQAQELLAQVLNNTPIPIEIDGVTYQITSLKLGVQNLIAEESCKIQKAQEGNTLDLYRQFAQSIPAVIRCLCYAILNDKNKIFKDYVKREYSEEYYALYESIEWCSDRNTWMEVLVQIMNRIDLNFFFYAASTFTTLREQSLKTRKKMVVQSSTRQQLK